MYTYISLLRGINVTGYKKINMKELTAVYQSLEFENVRTYIQSGNVIFESSESNIDKLSKIIESAIKKKYSFEVSVFILTPNELQKIIERNPFPKKDFKPLMVTLLNQEPIKEKIKSLEVLDTNYEKYEICGKVIYLYFPNGYGRAKLNNNFLENKLKVRATTRNWRTLNKLLEMINEKQ